MSTIENRPLADLLQSNHSAILSKWKGQQHVQDLLNSKQISMEFFIKHFGSRILDYFIGVLHGECAPGQCPVIMVMLKFFTKHGLTLDEIFQICSGKRNAVIHTLLENSIAFSDDMFTTANELFDMNFAGVIREYTDITYGVHSAASDEVGPSCPLTKDEIVPIDTALIREYFAKDDDGDHEKILFRTEDADDMLEYLSEISERLSYVMFHSDRNEIQTIAAILSKISSILLHYSPYLDSLAASMNELSLSLMEHSEPFLSVLTNNEAMIKLFDAVSSDMDRYIERFSVESIAMKNTHHIHEPTSLSIRQIIAMYAPDQVDEGEIEFF